MPKQKQEVTIAAIKVTNALKAAIETEMDLDNREQPSMIKVLLAEAVSTRQAKRNMAKLL